MSPVPLTQTLAQAIEQLGFASWATLDLTQPDLLQAALARFEAWLSAGLHGEMDYLPRSLALRADPQTLLPGARSALLVTMNYLPEPAGWQDRQEQALSQPGQAVVSVYARGRDYHKVLRQRLARLGAQLAAKMPGAQFRACVDSAPIFEVSLAAAASLGWRGKHTLLLNRDQGSMFFLGVLLTDQHLPAHAPDLRTTLAPGGCGSCSACLQACPTQAFLGPYELDARRCISYLTIELEGDIPEALRPLMGQRVYGCDDCQRVCPWNQYAQKASLPDFAERHGLGTATLMELFAWTEDEFRDRHAGSAILRIGHKRWLRNLAVGLGNALRSALAGGQAELAEQIRACLLGRRHQASPSLARHLDWALAQGTQS